MDLERLQNLFQKQMLQNSQAVRAFPWHDADSYALYLKQTWGFVRHSCALLGGCASRLGDTPQVQKRFFDHVVEEFGHEALAERDIKVMGYDFDQLPVLSTTKGFVHAQYYHVHHVSPFAFFGYILLLETLPVQCADLLPGLIETHGLKAVSFMKLHVEEDVDHSQSAWGIISLLPPEALQAIYDNFEEASDNYCAMLNDITARSKIKTEELEAVC